jgi:hypothetical protein
MKVTVDGQVYDYDPTRLMLTEAIEVQEKTGLNLKRWQAGLEQMDAFAVKALVYLLKKRAGETPDWATLDFDLAGLEIEDDSPPDPSDAEAA